MGESMISRLNRRPWTLLLLLVIAAGGAAFTLETKWLGWMPPCQFYRWTDLHCPGCGGRRCVMMLAQGRWLEALRMNALVIFCGLGFGALLLKETWREWSQRGQTFVLSPRMGWAIAIAVIAFWILRNLRFFPFEWLAPVPIG